MLTATNSPVAFVFGGLSTEFESSVQMFLFLREELRQGSPGFLIRGFYYLDPYGNVHAFNSAESFHWKDGVGEISDGHRMTRSEFIQDLSREGSFVFSLLQGREGEDGILQGVVEFCDIPSNLGTIAAAYLSMDKWVFALAANAHCMNALMPVDSVLLNRFVNTEEIDRAMKHFEGREFVAKPNLQGASILLATSSQLNRTGLEKLALFASNLGDRLLLQERVAGDEITCGCVKMDGCWHSLGCMAIESASGLMGRLEKLGQASYSRTPLKDDELARRVEKVSLALANHFDFHTLCRFDFIVSGAGCLFLLEANSKPALTPASSYVAMLRNAGLDLLDLVRISVDNEARRRDALQDLGDHVRKIIASNGQL